MSLIFPSGYYEIQKNKETILQENYRAISVLKLSMVRKLDNFTQEKFYSKDVMISGYENLND